VRIVCWVFLLMLLVNGLSAHPHLFIESSLIIHFDEKGLAGIEETWVFDEMFSASVIDDQDKNQDGKFDEAETAVIKEEAFDNLKDFDYFTYIRINGEPFAPEYVKGFKPSIEKDKLVYNFYVPCHVSASVANKKIEVSIFDTSYFTAVTMLDEKPALQGTPDAFEVSTLMYRNKDFVFLGRDGFPETLTIKLRNKK